MHELFVLAGVTLFFCTLGYALARIVGYSIEFVLDLVL